VNRYNYLPANIYATGASVPKGSLVSTSSPGLRPVFKELKQKFTPKALLQ
jgi:hypothetical protein